MHRIIKSAVIALTLVGAGTLTSHRADAGPAAHQGLRATIESLDPIDAVACRRGDRQSGHHCARVVPRTDNLATSRLDEAGQPDSRRRFSRW
jgi:hypothetical protein